MDINNIGSIISSVGFPIFVCLVMMWYIKYKEDKVTEETKELNSQHTNEILELNNAHTREMLEFKNDIKVALDNNTKALEKLCDKLNERGNENEKN